MCGNERLLGSYAAQEGLANESQLQTWFVSRIARWLALVHNRTAMAWDEVRARVRAYECTCLFAHGCLHVHMSVCGGCRCRYMCVCVCVCVDLRVIQFYLGDRCSSFELHASLPHFETCICKSFLPSLLLS